MLPFALALKRALQIVGPVLHVNRSRIAAAIGNPLESLPFYLYHALYRSKAVAWLARQEEHYRFVILEADAEEPTGMWSQLVVSQVSLLFLSKEIFDSCFVAIVSFSPETERES